MGSRRAARPSRSHARPRRGLRARHTALVLGALTVTAGVGITVAVAGGDGGPASDRVAADGARHTPGAGTPAGGAAPAASPSATPSASASAASPSARPEKKKPERTATPEKKAAPAAERSVTRAPERTAGDRGGNGGGGSASGPASGSGSGTAAGSGAGVAAGGPEAQVLALVNEERAAAGCAPVTENARLTRAADDYSDVMAESGVMSHTGPDGSTMTTRVEAAGYAWSTLGENIARGQADAAAVMESWMNSPGHRANILNCSFKELGVGVHFGDGGPWWTQNFGAPR